MAAKVKARFETKKPDQAINEGKPTANNRTKKG
jgi:hypothetical protein